MQIEELEAKLEVERRKRQEIEDQLKEVQTVVKQATSQGLDTKGAQQFSGSGSFLFILPPGPAWFAAGHASP